MKSYNKILSLLLALAIFVTAFTSCDLFSDSGSLSGETTTESSSDNSTTFPAEDTSDEYISTEQTTESNAEETVSTAETETTEAGSSETEPPETTESSEIGSTEATEADSSETESTETERGELEKRPLEEIIEAVNSPSDYAPAGSYEEALDRSQNGELSGYPFVPDQAPIISEYQPTKDGKLIKNNDSYYLDHNTYVVIDAYGREVFRIYRGGAYITLEEVAAYVYAFGTYPANHTAKKATSVSGNIWGIYLRSNHSRFSGNTSKYPYEPELPRISGCGGDLQYWEMDIGTTGTDCDPGYPSTIYNNGTKITRGAARIVYTWNDLNNNGINDGNDVVFVFYTYNHYNDFQEYLNYYGGWGEMFGNITGGGKISSKTDYNPTEYVPVYTGSLKDGIAKTEYIMFAWVDRRAFELLLNA